MTTEIFLQLIGIPLLIWILSSLNKITERLARVETRLDNIETHLDPKVEIIHRMPRNVVSLKNAVENPS